MRRATYELWTTDGTAAGTVELVPVTGAGITANVGLNPSDLTVLGNQVLFNGVNNVAGNLGGLWTTNGTAAGTHEITGITGAASTGVNPSDLTVYNGEALFNGVEHSGRPRPVGDQRRGWPAPTRSPASPGRQRPE